MGLYYPLLWEIIVTIYHGKKEAFEHCEKLMLGHRKKPGAQFENAYPSVYLTKDDTYKYGLSMDVYINHG